ncbi:Light-harvesting complex [Amphidinium carterae]|mmetsp:Transcript_2135/g.5412  ORF Transcript_2135/g.5412 Transcript_2135/m.5412 type:complete len:292 (+) Transcript_2135:77-952(+)
MAGAGQDGRNKVTVAVAAGLTVAGACTAFVASPGQALRGHGASHEHARSAGRPEHSAQTVAAVSAGVIAAGVTAATQRRPARVTRNAKKEEKKDKKAEKAEKLKEEEDVEEAADAEAPVEAVEATQPKSPKEFDVTAEPGVTEPLGFWDPLDYCPPSKDKFLELRRAELKHGRVAMMAAVGFVVQHFITFPGFGDVSRGWDAMYEFPGNLGTLLLLAGIGYVELNISEEDGKYPGDFGDPAGLLKTEFGSYDMDMRNREINNGRFAMIAAMGIIAAEDSTGKDAIEQLFGI